MNRIKKVLEENGIKQTCLTDNLGKITTWSTTMFKINNNRDLRYCMTLRIILKLM